MVTFTHTRELREAQFVDVDLRGARFVEADLSGVVMRAVEVSGADIDAPWLIHGKSFLVNGVDVIPLVEATLNERFPGRADRRADDPDGLRAAWTALENTWHQTMERVAAMPADSVDISVDGEWSFAQTLRHLILATDTWLGRGVLQLEQAQLPSVRTGRARRRGRRLGHVYLHPDTPPYADVVEARAGRIAMVRDYLASVTSDQLDAIRTNPWAPQERETIRSCLHVILEEEWEHHRYAVRDLKAIESMSTPKPSGGATDTTNAS